MRNSITYKMQSPHFIERKIISLVQNIANILYLLHILEIEYKFIKMRKNITSHVKTTFKIIIIWFINKKILAHFLFISIDIHIKQ